MPRDGNWTNVLRFLDPSTAGTVVTRVDVTLLGIVECVCVRLVGCSRFNVRIALTMYYRVVRLQ
jgi:hypothetical protein